MSMTRATLLPEKTLLEGEKRGETVQIGFKISCSSPTRGQAAEQGIHQHLGQTQGREKQAHLEQIESQGR